MASNVKVDKITPTTNCGTVTLGDSGDTISIPSGASLSIGGSVSGIDGIVNWDTTAKTSGFTAVAGTGYFVNTTSAAITVTLPASPTAGDLVAVKDYAFTADTNNITLARNGSNIQGTANDFLISTEGRSVTLIYVDATQGWLLTGASQKTDIITPQYVTATGGTITTCGDFKVHTFTSPGTFCVSCAGNSDGSNSVDYFVVAGGGGGGAGGPGSSIPGAGGGAGGFRVSNSTCMPAPTTSPLANPTGLPVSVTAYPITVGGGGAAGIGTVPRVPGINGSNSVFSTITSAGGGGGGTRDNSPETGLAGGSGGGSAGTCNVTGAAGNTPPVSPPQGNPGGRSATSPGVGKMSAGGGGAGAAGGEGTPGPSLGGVGSFVVQSGFAGCNGTPGPVGSTKYFSGGGGVGASPTYSSTAGGAGGGGPGGTPSTAGTAGTTNTGGGGGAGSASNGPAIAGAGGSGIVIIRYKYQ